MLNVYKINDHDCVAANSCEEAKQLYKKETGFGDEEIYIEKIVDIESKTMWLEHCRKVEDYIIENDIESQFRSRGGLLFMKFTFKQVMEIEEIESLMIIASRKY